ncbi:MAG: ATP-dependent RecD-like DNA helicase [Hyphomicrobiaceae bacterium]
MGLGAPRALWNAWLDAGLNSGRAVERGTSVEPSPSAPTSSPNAAPRFSETEILTDEIRAIREGIASGRSMFVCGRAGVGKSRQLMWVKEWAAENGITTACLAPTGVAAVNVGGQTIHSFFRFPIGGLTEADARKVVNATSDRLGAMRRPQLFVIDEVSMVRADLMHAVDHALRTLHGDPDTPFGGRQVVCFGDVYQLPPVVKRDDDEAAYLAQVFGSSMFFAAPGIRHFRLGELSHIFRQREVAFAEALNDVRDGHYTARARKIFDARVGMRDATAVTLTTTRKKAAEINDRELLSRVEKGARSTVFQAKLEGTAKPSDFLAPETLEVCIGARAMTLYNDKDGRFRNGTVGTVVDFGDGWVKLALDDGRDADSSEPAEVVSVTQMDFEKTAYTWSPGADTLGREVVGKMTQIPLQLAWAVTIHKSQGLSLDRVHVDLQFGAFEAGQAYVALSRCRTLAGLTLERPLWRKDVMQHRDAGRFREPCAPTALQRGPGSISRGSGHARPSRRKGAVSALRVTIPGAAPAAPEADHPLALKSLSRPGRSW